MKIVRVATQAALDAALADTASLEIWLVGSGIFYVLRETPARHWVRAYGSAQVTAYDSAQVTAYDSAQVRAYHSAQVTAYDSAQVRAYHSAQVTAYDSAQVTAYDSAQVTAYDSAQVTASDSAQVRAYGSAQVTAYHSAQVTASKYVAVTSHGRFTRVDGGVRIDVQPMTTAQDWCEYYGVTVSDGIAVLYKAVRADYRSARGTSYAPGTVPIASDWDGGRDECGGGLHFSPRPVLAKAFDAEATTYLACPVALADMRAPQENDAYPNKIKAKGCAAPVYEVDIDGQPIKAAVKP